MERKRGMGEKQWATTFILFISARWAWVFYAITKKEGRVINIVGDDEDLINWWRAFISEEPW